MTQINFLESKKLQKKLTKKHGLSSDFQLSLSSKQLVNALERAFKCRLMIFNIVDIHRKLTKKQKQTSKKKKKNKKTKSKTKKLEK